MNLRFAGTRHTFGWAGNPTKSAHFSWALRCKNSHLVVGDVHCYRPRIVRMHDRTKDDRVTEKPISIGILETGRPPEQLEAEFGDYPGMVSSWLAPFSANFVTYAAIDGVLPASATDCDLWVITGSRFGVYEDLPWIAGLEQFIRDCRDAGRKMIGICFGHQLIAQALGGTVVKSQKGWGLGVHEYEPMNWPAALGAKPEHITMQAYHQDQIERLPQQAVQIARSEFCEFAALWYPGFALSVQGHPEFATPYFHALLEARRGTILSDEQVATAVDTFDQPTTRGDLAKLINTNLSGI